MAPDDAAEPLLADRGANAAKASLPTLARVFLMFGVSAFGGPAAHIGFFEKVFVEKHGWLDGSTFAELLALCQMMPGPSSTQLAFALGVSQQGVLGGLVSGLLFLMPGAIVMTLLGVGAAAALQQGLLASGTWPAAAAAGLAAVGVALVGNAALGLGGSICRTRLTQIVCAAATAATLIPPFPVPWLFPVVLVCGGAISVAYIRIAKALDPQGDDPESSAPIEHHGRQLVTGLRAWQGILLIATWAALLIALSAYELSSSGQKKSASTAPLHWFYAFFYTGSLVYGGGPVVLPVLQSIICEQRHWITDAQFLAGLGLAQAMPGPMFNLSPFLGASIANGQRGNALVGAVACWCGIFGPGIILIFGVLPLWDSLRSNAIYQGALPGVKAAAVGLIFASIFTLHASLQKASPFPTASDSIAVVGFALIRIARWPPPVAVLTGGVLGVVVWGCGMGRS